MKKLIPSKLVSHKINIFDVRKCKVIGVTNEFHKIKYKDTTGNLTSLCLIPG
jgi:hypothetical protein